MISKKYILEPRFWSEESIDSMKDNSYFFRYVPLSLRVQAGVYESKEEAIDHYVEMEKFSIDVCVEEEKLVFSNGKNFPVIFTYDDRIVDEKEFWKLAKERFKNGKVKFISYGATSYLE